MRNSYLKSFIGEYMNIVEENIVHGHYVETDFRHYSQLVRTLVKKTRELNGDQAIFFTALCLPPYQWFNFSAGRSIKTAKKVADIQEVIEADPVWVLYLEFIYELAKKEQTFGGASLTLKTVLSIDLVLRIWSKVML